MAARWNGSNAIILLLIVSTLAAGAALADGAPAGAPLPAAAQRGAAVGEVVVPLPKGTRPEGVAAGRDDGELFVSGISGWVLHVNVSSGASTLLANISSGGATGLKHDPAQDALFVTGALQGNAHVLHLERPKSGGVRVARNFTLQLAPPYKSFINDVLIIGDTVYFSDSLGAAVHAIPRVFPAGTTPQVTSYSLGPVFVSTSAADLRANGLAQIAPGVLAVTNYAQGTVWRAQLPPAASAAAGNASASVVVTAATRVTVLPLPLKLGGKRLFPDGLAVWSTTPTTSSSSGAATATSMFFADNFNSRVVQVRFTQPGAAAAGALVGCVIENPKFNTPTTVAVARGGGRLWAVNAHLLDCIPLQPCLEQSYEVVGVRPSDYGCDDEGEEGGGSSSDGSDDE